MKVLFNGACLVKGGALTVAASVIHHALRDPGDFQWSFAISRVLADECARLDMVLPEDTAVFDTSPSHSLRSRRELRSAEARFQPDAVFTLFGPTYVKFQAPHVMGCAIPWVTNPNWAAYRTERFPWGPIRRVLMHRYHVFWLRYANAWITQTETSRHGLARRLHVPAERIDVVANTCDQNYLEKQGSKPFPQPSEKIRLLCFTAAYRHKNLLIVPRVAKQLQALEPSLDFEFVLTLPPQNDYCKEILTLAASLGVSHRITNIGPVSLIDGPALYQSCHICFLPTVLEVFTATYPEAMAMGLPIVTSNLGFARDVCRDGALYYDYWDVPAAAECVRRLLGSCKRWESQLDRGKAALACLPNPSDRYCQYVACVRKLIE